MASMQQLHDNLLASMPEGVEHVCDICTPAHTPELAKEEAEVADKRTFTEDEHLLLMANAVAQETASLTARVEALESEKAAAQAQSDVLEAEKASLTTERDAIKVEFDQFKADLAEQAAVAERRDARLTKVRTEADHLPDDYFTTERAERWAAMSEESFEVAVADLVATKPEASADMAKCPQCGADVPVKDGMMAEHQVEGAACAGSGKKKQTAAQETAAFTGGKTPTVSTDGGSTVGQFLASWSA